MGSGADDFKTSRTLKETLGTDFRHVSDERLTSLTQAAEDLAVTDNMRFEDALKILSGQTRTPYGTNKP